MIKMRYKYNS